MYSTGNATTRHSLRLLPMALALCLGPQAVWSDDDDSERRRSSSDSSSSTAASFDITRARYRSERRRVEVEGDGQSDLRVAVVNAFDTDQILGGDRVEDGEWSVRASRLSPVPCRVLATQADGQVVEADVQNAPSNCAPKAPVNPPPATPSLSINNVTVNEDAGNASFTVSLSASSSQNVRVEYATRNGTATSGQNADYLESNGTLNIPAGTSSATVNVPINDDSTEEPNETFFVDLSSPENATIADASGVCTIVDNDGSQPPPPPPPPAGDVSINSTSQNSVAGSAADPYFVGPVPEQPFVGNNTHKVLAINDLGMHCGDLDTRVASILPPFQVLLTQVIARGGEPDLLGPGQATVEYSAVANPNDPILSDPNAFRGVTPDGDVYKTNFWDVASAAYGPFYPPGVLDAFYDPNDPDANKDIGLPVPNVEELYLGSGALVATQHAMPGLTGAYLQNVPQVAEEFYNDKPFFMNFPFGYVAQDLNWFEGAGVPFAAFDDFGRENAYPLVRVQAKVGDNVVATTDTVLPISGEASCKNCHSADIDVSPETPHAGSALPSVRPVATQMDDPAVGDLPVNVSIEYATDLNILRLHDEKHGTDLEGAQPVVCQTCHYTPALDLAHVGPKGAGDADANGRTQLTQSTMSNVMHGHHGETGKFPEIPPAIQAADGSITNQAARLAALEQNCYQCHPGKNVQCLRGAMFNGGMLCSDCHGGLAQVGNDFSRDVSPTNDGLDKFILSGNFYDPNDPQPRVPWANEPGCGSCHTGDATSNLAGTTGTRVNTQDANGNADGIRLRQAFRNGDNKATPIVPGNKRFAEPMVPASFNGTPNNGAGNPQLYRVSTGHGGVMCEGCHGATHAEWPNGNPNANDNVTANQLQGHTGTIAECTVCHETGQLSARTQGGPHGMHLVNDSRFVRESGHGDLAESENGRPGGGTCGACHGADHRGTVLSRAAADRTFNVEGRTVTIQKGEPVGCGHCHSISESFD